jgi:hypothetical protein
MARTESRSTVPSLSEKTVSNIKLLCDVARANGTSLSVADIIMLTSLDFTEEELVEAWDNCKRGTDRSGGC